MHVERWTPTELERTQSWKLSFAKCSFFFNGQWAVNINAVHYAVDGGEIVCGMASSVEHVGQ